jgi:hypothetical protein
VVYYRFPGLIDEIMTLISKFGNLPLTCPILKGNYFLKDFHMDPDSIAFSIIHTTISKNKKSKSKLD